MITTESKEPALPVSAPVVVTKTKVSLADHLNLAEMPLATTPAGKVFAMKCLHPADSEIKTSRVPGGLVPSLSVACDMVETLPFPAGATDCAIIQWAQPQCPLSIIFTAANGTMVDYYVWQNSALGGTGLLHAPANLAAITGPFMNFQRNYEKYRITAQSVTCDVIAPAVADQGTITSAQFTVMPVTVQQSTFSTTGFNYTADVWLYHDPPAEHDMLMGTSAYTSKAKDGFYQPLKLDKFKWVNCQDKMMPCRDPFFVSGQFGHDAETAACSNFPVWTNNSVIVKTSIAFVKPSSNVVGITYVSGTAGNPQVSLRIRARQVTEVVPVLGSPFAPLAEAPYPPDDLSVRMVREVSARMKDAYPASYNAKGTLKGVIGSIANGILKYADPALDLISLIPGAGTFVGALRTGIGIAKGVKALRDNPTKENQVAVQEALNQGLTQMRKSRKKKKKGQVEPKINKVQIIKVPTTRARANSR